MAQTFFVDCSGYLDSLYTSILLRAYLTHSGARTASLCSYQLPIWDGDLCSASVHSTVRFDTLRVETIGLFGLHQHSSLQR
jgi:hypothetical protein